jgi:uncharacterized membrane protein YkvA (DUF1232 family)
MGQEPPNAGPSEDAPDGEVAVPSLRAVTALFGAVTHLIWGLSRDRRVGWRDRAKLKMVGVWLSSPIDPIPDWLPVVGHLDDMLIAAVALNRVVSRIEPAVVRDHWPSRLDYAQVAGRVVSAAASAMPWAVSRRVFVPRQRTRVSDAAEEVRTCPPARQGDEESS